MTATQRAAKRHARENRKNKGVSTTAKLQARAAEVRDARHALGNIQSMDDGMVLLAASMLLGKGKR